MSGYTELLLFKHSWHGASISLEKHLQFCVTLIIKYFLLLTNLNAPSFILNILTLVLSLQDVGAYKFEHCFHFQRPWRGPKNLPRWGLEASSHNQQVEAEDPGLSAVETEDRTGVA